MTDHNQATSGIQPGVRSGRGERRPHTAYAWRTNHPLELPAALRGKGHTPIGRRWRDLCRHWGNKLGPERLRDEGTRAKLLNLIWMTLELEAMRDADSARRSPVHTQLHLCQEQRTLLAELGLSEPAHSNGDGLAQTLRNGGNGVAPPDPVGVAP